MLQKAGIKKLGNQKEIFSNRCWTGNTLQPATVCFAEGKITAIHFIRTEGAEDLGDSILMPGVIDAHVHINEPGRTDWEGFDKATLSAAAGGITTIVDMPLNASPVTTTVNALNEKRAASKHKLHVNCGFYGGSIPGNARELEGLIKAGVMGIKCFLAPSGIDEFPLVTERDLEAAMPLLAKYAVPLLVHCELVSACGDLLHSAPTSYAAYLASRPMKWENDAIALMIRLCRKFNCPVHIVHVSSAEALGMIAMAKKEGLPLTAETCAHYIYFNAEDIPDAQCIYKCAPPIRDAANNLLLKGALKNGVLDFITTDHSPAPPEIKEIGSGNLLKAWGGIAGLQFLLPASWAGLKGLIPLQKFIPLLTEYPAKFTGTGNYKGKIAIGYDADLVVWDPEEKWIVRAEDILFRHKISPYIGQTLAGVVRQTIVHGIVVFRNHEIVQKNAGKEEGRG